MGAELAGEVAIVTGGGRGFGRAIATALANAGAAVTITSRSTDELSNAAAALAERGCRAYAVAGDVTEAEDVRRVVAAGEEQFGAATVFVHAAGVGGPFGPIWENDGGEWWRTQEVHVRGALLYAQALMPRMIASRRGRILHIASRAGLRVVENVSAYSLSKATLIRFTEHIATEGTPHGIRAFAVDPGTVYTDLAASTIASADAKRWAPSFVEMLTRVRDEQDADAGLQRCANLCLALCTGRHDGLSGRLVSVDDPLPA
jgi:NAD(P)-dependent dehydrogenase (short-subunit alcohol dehydrogenase family)